MPKKGELVYHRKDGLWEARYIKEIDIFGKKKYGSVYAHSCKEVKKKRQNIVDNIRLYNKPPVTRDMTVAQLVAEYLYVSKNRIKPSTYQRYESLYRNHIERIGRQPIIYLNTTTIHEFALSRLGVGLTPQTVNSILVFLHSCLKYGHRCYNLPMPDILYLTPIKKEMRVFTQEEQKRLTAYLHQEMDIYKFGVLLALYTGVRIGELCGLKWEDINDNCIKIKRTVQRLSNNEATGTELYIGPPKTATSIREIPVASFLKELTHHFRCNSTCEYVLGTEKIPIAEPRIMQIRFKKYLEEAGISEANFHALRHSFATRCIECGFELKSLSEVLGHANVKITLDKYVHSSFQLKIENMEKLAQAL